MPGKFPTRWEHAEFTVEVSTKPKPAAEPVPDEIQLEQADEEKPEEEEKPEAETTAEEEEKPQTPEVEVKTEEVKKVKRHRKPIPVEIDEPPRLRKDAYDGAESVIRMPDECLLPPDHDPLTDICIPSPDVRVFVGSPWDYTETDLEYRLSLPVPERPWKDRERYTLPTSEIHEEPWISTWRTQRQCLDPFSVYDPVGESLCVGREKPGLSRCEMLPTGGNKWDIPSDTDSDGRDNEWCVPGPSDNYLEAYFETDRIPELLNEQAPIVNDRWEKEKALDEKLENDARARNVALRDKLTEFNAVLEPRLKLFLG